MKNNNYKKCLICNKYICLVIKDLSPTGEFMTCIECIKHQEKHLNFCFCTNKNLNNTKFKKDMLCHCSFIARLNYMTVLKHENFILQQELAKMDINWQTIILGKNYG